MASSEKSSSLLAALSDLPASRNGLDYLGSKSFYLRSIVNSLIFFPLKALFKKTK